MRPRNASWGSYCSLDSRTGWLARRHYVLNHTYLLMHMKLTTRLSFIAFMQCRLRLHGMHTVPVAHLR